MRKMREAHKVNNLIAALRLVAVMSALVIMGGLTTAMTVLAADRNTVSKAGENKSYPCAADIFYKGGMICVNASGYAAPAQDAISFVRVVGVATENVDNSAGSAGDLNVRVQSGRNYKFAATAITQAMLGQTMYVVDDQTFDDSNQTYAIPAGILTEFVSSTEGYIYIPTPAVTARNFAQDYIIGALGAAVVGNGFYVNVANPNNALGMSAYFDATISGTTAGHHYGLGSWINIAASTIMTSGNICVPFEGGVFESSATMTNARIVFAGQHQAILTNTPATIHAWRLNVAQAIGNITAVIAAANPESVAFTSGAGTSSTKNGDVAMFDIVGTGVVYVRTYDGTG